MGECLTGHIESTKNPADLATKFIPKGQKRDYLIGKLIYDICDYLCDERFTLTPLCNSLKGYLRFPIHE